MLCERCSKVEAYWLSSRSEKQLCVDCYNFAQFGIGAPRAGKSMVYNKCLICGDIFGTNAWKGVCERCEIIVTWKSSMNYLEAVNRISELIKEGKLDPKLRNENYCRTNFGQRAAQAIMDSVDSARF